MTTLTTQIELPRFSPPPITPMGSAQIIQIVAPILSNRLSVTKYDRVILAIQYIKHLREMRSVDPNITALDAFSNFQLDSSLGKANGNSCVGLSLDLMQFFPKEIAAYPAGAILSNRYQQKFGPRYSHVTPLIAYQNPKDPKDRGYVILDPSFHIGEPILLPLSGSPYPYDMGGKKGLWIFSLAKDHIHCQPGPRPGEMAWDSVRTADSLMIYRMDRIENPEESSALPMFAIDRSYPIVSRMANGTQIAHINVDLNKKEIQIKLGKEKREPVSFISIHNGTYRFDSQLACALLLDEEDLNQSISLIVQEADSLDELYQQFIGQLKSDELLRSNLRDPL